MWRNAKFDKLKDIKELDEYEPRHDPTVIPILPHSDAEAASINSLPAPKPRIDSNHHYTSADYISLYKSGKLTPSHVAEILIALISKDPNGEHSVAFLESRADLVREGAKASTKRYQEGKPLGPLDGVPVAVKDEVDLKGYKRTLGSKLDFTNKDDETAWCVKQWEEAGAIVIGKTNMHEIGLGMSLPHNPQIYLTPSNLPSSSPQQTPQTTTHTRPPPETPTIPSTTPAAPPAAPPTPSPRASSPSPSAPTAAAQSASPPPSVESTA